MNAYTQLTVDGSLSGDSPFEYADPSNGLINQAKELVSISSWYGENAELVEFKSPWSIRTLSILIVMSNVIFESSTNQDFKTPSFGWMMKVILLCSNRLSKQFGLGVPRPSSVILDATNGETKEYSLDEVPEWWTVSIPKKLSNKSTTTAV